MEQKVIIAENCYTGLEKWIEENGCRKIFMVCGGWIFHRKEFIEHLEKIRKRGVEVIGFRDFRPNPLYEDVQEGVKLFREENCDGVIAVGGGSAMDVAKCVKACTQMEGDGEDGVWLEQDILPNNMPFLAMPTTAGTGSEATRYAVIYYDGKKQSVTSENLIPGAVLMVPGMLKSLPLYQRKATMCDALCHGIESFWSVNSTKESREYSRKALEAITEHMAGYLSNTEEGNAGMLLAAHTAGKAINITQTTAGHAMCYKITSLFGCAHGHGGILCNRVLYHWMAENTDRCIDARGKEYLEKTLDEIGQAMGGRDAREGAARLAWIFETLELDVPAATEAQFEELRTSVNPVRLKNHPIWLDEETLDMLYHRMLRNC